MYLTGLPILSLNYKVTKLILLTKVTRMLKCFDWPCFNLPVSWIKHARVYQHHQVALFLWEIQDY